MDLGPLRPYTWAVLLGVFVPVSWILDVVLGPGVVVFAVAGIAIVPLAWFLGLATEELGKLAGPGVGGLLNATFGNATEMIIAVFALGSGLTEVVKASLTGSIIGNALLVLGLSMLAGGLRHKTQLFSREASLGKAICSERPRGVDRARRGRERDFGRFPGDGAAGPRADGTFCRGNHRGDRRERRRAWERGPDGGAEQDGSQRRRGDHFHDAGRLVRRTASRLCFLDDGATHDPRLRDFRARLPGIVHRRGRRGRLRRAQQLVRRSPPRDRVRGDRGRVPIPPAVRPWYPARPSPTDSPRTSSSSGLCLSSRT